MLAAGVMMMMVHVMMVLEEAEEEAELYSSILQELLMLLVQLIPEVELEELLNQINLKLEQEAVVLVGPLYFKVEM